MKSFVAISAAFVVLVSSLVSANQFNYKSVVDYNPEVLDIFRKAEMFNLDFLSYISNDKKREDFGISSYSLWVLLLLLAEGGNFPNTIRSTNSLHQDRDHRDIRTTFNEVIRALEIKTPSVEVAKWQGIFADFHQLVGEDYIKLVNTSYNTGLKRLDFNNTQNVMQVVSEELNLHTNHLLDIPIRAEYFLKTPVPAKHWYYAKFLMSSTVYLKGRWQFPLSERRYNKTDDGDGRVELMSPSANFQSSDMRNIQAIVTELPFGNEGRLSMLLVEPHEGVFVHDVIGNVRMIGLRSIFEQLASASSFRNGADIIVPKFKATMELSLEGSLEKLAFSAFRQGSVEQILGWKYLNDIRQTFTITMNEEGIEVAAVDSTVFNGNPLGCKVLNKRPNLYLIVDPLTYFIHFAFVKGEAIY